ncbi:hypothetical protein JCM9534A_35930 [Catenuloplanes indicus JCM 9534]
MRDRMLYDIVPAAGAPTMAAPSIPSAQRDTRRFDGGATLASAIDGWIECAVLLAGRGLQIRQFLHIDAGRPAAPAVHNLADVVVRDPRVVYTDHDPRVAAAGARQLPAGGCGRVRFLHVDLTTAGSSALDDVRAVLDPRQPVAVIVPPRAGQRGPQGYEAVRKLVAGLPAGSLLALAAATADAMPRAERRAREAVGASPHWYSYAQVERLFDGLDLLPPGVLPVRRWTSTHHATQMPLAWAALGRRP